ncbi:hypothetical protein [Roseobacter sp.]|uniref:hypothetical protein n=1 Tax=Roseobacter sp. TaxID=1907202 RepID=UPI00385844FE
MVKTAQDPNDCFNVVIVAQKGRLTYEALLFAASLRHCSPNFSGRLLVTQPNPGPLWSRDPRVSDPAALQMFESFGAEIIPFDCSHFGADYPYGNKIEMLTALPKGEPFVFFDTDTLVTGDLTTVPFDFSRPTASMRRESTWPKPQLYGPSYSEIWRALYEKFGLDFATSLDPDQPDEHWEKYLYFNAGYFFYECPHGFGNLFREYSVAIRDDPPAALCAQELHPWLDQIALPLVIHALGGGRDTLPAGLLDGSVTCHYRMFPLLYARENDNVIKVLEEVAAPNKLKKILKQHDPIKRNVYQGRGAKVRALFDQDDLPRREATIRNRIKSNGFWMR